MNFDDVQITEEAQLLNKFFKLDPIVRLEKINEGSFGKVFKGIWALRDEYVAIKYIPYAFKGHYKYKQAINEVKVMEAIRNNIPKNCHKHYSFVNFTRE